MSLQFTRLNNSESNGLNVNTIYANASTLINSYNSIINTLGLGVYDGLLAQKLQTTVTRTTAVSSAPTPVVHNDQAVGDDYLDTTGVYYFNYGDIYNTLNRNIGGSTYMDNTEVLDEGTEIGQRYPILWGLSQRKTPFFLADSERDAYANYTKYAQDYYGTLSMNDTTLLSEGKSGYTTGVVRQYNIGGTTNPNSATDTFLGKLSSAILGNIVTARNTRKEQRGFQSITNISYYGKGRTDLEESKEIDSLDTAVGMSYSQDRPQFGIRNDYAYVGFGNATLEYTYSASTDVNYSLFDKWGELSNGTIALDSSPAYKSLVKSEVLSTGNGSGSTIYFSDKNLVDVSQFLLQNLKYKGNLVGNTSFETYLARHGFDITIGSSKNRYKISTNSLTDLGDSFHTAFHYDEGKINTEVNTSNGGTTHGTYITSKAVDSCAKDLVNATNNAFRQEKYDTIISRFATQKIDDSSPHPTQSAISRQFGMSHGRNLLKVKKDAKSYAVLGVDTDGGNGYDNPYCRVWTYHHQYNRLCDAIRPLTDSKDSRQTCTYDKTSGMYTQAVAKYRNSAIKDDTTINNRASMQIIASEGQDLLYENSVLNKHNGLVNITPTNLKEDADKYVDIRNCMFSIENLAWKDVDRNSNYNLSPEQVGPFGGRIMWFPPYGLTFHEQTQANWNPISFIGRGEKVYTYGDTDRTGNLSFIMLIDHPSVINEWRGNTDGEDGSQDVDDIDSKEQTLLRFFAGCEILAPIKAEEKTEPETPPAPEEEPEPKTQPNKICFAVYYPNNYSGVDDGYESALIYLINGIGFGSSEFTKFLQIENWLKQSVELRYHLSEKLLDCTYQVDIDNTLKKEEAVFTNIGLVGYEMNQNNTNYGVSGPVKDYNAIYYNFDVTHHCEDEIIDRYIGLETLSEKAEKFTMQYENNSTYYLINYRGNFRVKCFDSQNVQKVNDTIILPFNEIDNKDYKHPSHKGQGPKNYEWQESKGGWADDYLAQSSWGYRVDAAYLEQKLEVNTTQGKGFNDYADGQSVGLNARAYDHIFDIKSSNSDANESESNTADSVGEYIKSTNAQLYSFIDVYAALEPDYANYQAVKERCETTAVTEVSNILKNRKITAVTVKGCASKQGRSNANNNTLATNRAQTVIDWLKSKEVFKSLDIKPETFDVEATREGGSTWQEREKATRCAIVVIELEDEETTDASDKNSTVNTSYSAETVQQILDPTFENSLLTTKYSGEEIYELNQLLSKKGCTTIETVLTYWNLLGNIPSNQVIYNPETENKMDSLPKLMIPDDRETLYTDKSAQSIVYDVSRIQDVKYVVWYPLDGYGNHVMIPKSIAVYINAYIDDYLEDANKQFISQLKKKDIKHDLLIGYFKWTVTDTITIGDALPYDMVNQDTTTAGDPTAENDATENADENTNKGEQAETSSGVTRYDNESDFFRTLAVTDPFLHSRIKDKIKYFDPAYHSVSPEGFAARLTFLNQCTRQGNTISKSDADNNEITTASNLAFGRPPVCILRIGDFYYTRIIIDSLNISYENGDGIQWDLNTEGIGVMPMYAKVEISFKFIGGSDLTGPVSRLQNAMSFNYYANTRVYDNRSDGVTYDYENPATPPTVKPWIAKIK